MDYEMKKAGSGTELASLYLKRYEKAKTIRQKWEGNVSTENNGGFIQFRAEVEIEDKDYKGLKIKTRGNGEEYYLFIRTTKTRLPWLYYGSPFNTSDEWEWIEIPFSSFKKSDGRFSRFLPKEFDIESIKSIGIVAYGKDFYADIDVAGLELY